jgi:hypothetical protein
VTAEDVRIEETHTSTPTELSNGMQGFETVGAFLERDGWHPEKLTHRTAYRFDFSGNHGNLRCYAHIRPDLEQFLFYAVAPIKAPESQRPVVAEYLTRANAGLHIGNFEMDYGDGEIRYRSSLDFEGTVLTPALIKNAIYPAVHTMDFYLPGLLSVMYGQQAPEKAIKAIER